MQAQATLQLSGTVVDLDAESELGLLLAWGVNLVRVARVRVVEVSWDVVDRTWHTSVRLLVSLLLLDISDLCGELSAVIDSRSLSTLCGHAEWSTFRDVRHMDGVVSARAQVSQRLIFVAR